MCSVLSPRQRQRRPWAAGAILGLGLVWVSGAHAQAALGLTDAMAEARANAPRLVAQAARLTAAREDAARAGRLPDPTLSVGVDNLTVTGPEAFRVGAGEMTMRRIGMMQSLPSRRARDAERRLASAQVDIVDGEAQALVRQTERAAGEAWIEVWMAEREQAALRAQIADAERASRVSETQLAHGTGAAASALAAQAAQAELESAVLSAAATARAARAGLARWLGDERAAQPLAEAPDFATLPLSPAELLAGAGAHAELLPWDARERAAAAAVDAARARKRPQFAVGASYGARSAGLADMAMFEVSVALPLFPRQRQDRDIAARRAEAAAVAAEREEATRAHRETVQRQLAVWEGLRAERERLNNRALPLARDRHSVALASYANGESIQPWLDARRDELALLRRVVQTDAALARAWLQLTTLTTTNGDAP